MARAAFALSLMRVSLADRLAKPAYLWRPGQIVRRVLVLRRGGEALVRLPWGSSLAVDTRESVGSGIARTGVHELAVTETMWRLCHEEDLAIDAGANIGYYTSLLAIRCRGVLALEPHPVLHRRLAANVGLWATREKVRLHERAVSSSSTTASLSVPSDFDRNHGTATLAASDAHQALSVRTVTLDEVIDGRAVGLLKLDVEGHELEALRGAERSLPAVRDILFEDHERLPTTVSRFLEDRGYTIFGLAQGLRGVKLVEPRHAHAQPAWDAPTYLATRHPERARHLTAGRGWHCLHRIRRSPAPA